MRTADSIDPMAAHHEAGHAVAYIVLGLPFKNLKLEGDGLGGGAVVAQRGAKTNAVASLSKKRARS